MLVDACSYPVPSLAISARLSLSLILPSLAISARPSLSLIVLALMNVVFVPGVRSQLFADRASVSAAIRDFAHSLTMEQRQRHDRSPLKPMNSAGSFHQLLPNSFRASLEEAEHFSFRSAQPKSDPSTEQVFLVGERLNGLNLSDFCSGLLLAELSKLPSRRRDAIVFHPAQPITSPSELLLSIPKMWLRQGRGKRKRDLQKTTTVPVYLCREGTRRISLVQMRLNASHFVGADEHIEHVFSIESDLDRTASSPRPAVFSSSLSPVSRSPLLLSTKMPTIRSSATTVSSTSPSFALRGAAVVLDNAWNTAYLLPPGAVAMLSMSSKVDQPRIHTFDRTCDPRLGQEQECCLQPFHSYSSVDATTVSRPLTFHRCIGRPPERERLSRFRFLPEHVQETLETGGLSSRLVTPLTKVCRERLFRILSHTLRSSTHGIITQTLDHLDATECYVAY